MRKTSWFVPCAPASHPATVGFLLFLRREGAPERRTDCGEESGQGSFYQLPIPREKIFFLSSREELLQCQEDVLQVGPSCRPASRAGKTGSLSCASPGTALSSAGFQVGIEPVPRLGGRRHPSPWPRAGLASGAPSFRGGEGVCRHLPVFPREATDRPTPTLS